MAEADNKVSDMVEDEVEENKTRDPLLDAAEWRFILTVPDKYGAKQAKKDAQANLLAQIKRNDMAPFYESVCESLGWKRDASLLQQMRKANESKLAELDGKIKEAESTAGDNEVREAMLNRAHHFAQIGEKETALKAYEETFEKTVGAGLRIDVVLAIIRLSLFHEDVELTQTQIERAKELVESGGDWERRNLLKVYEAVHLMQARDFAGAAKLLLDSIATFTCYELFSYEKFVFYAVVTSVAAMDRVTLRTKVVKAPEILSTLRDVPHLESFLNSIYKCNYAEFMRAVAALSSQLRLDQYLAAHHNYLVRELRLVAYKQMLQSYRSVALASMADAFGVSTPFLDKDLSGFIASGRINCKIDKVNGVVETNRPDSKNSQYQQVLREGDLLLNRIQKLQKRISS